MKTKEARSSILVPRCVGRTEADFVARGYGKQLELFRETLTPRAKLQILAMMSLSDPKQLDQPNMARIADIARIMGYKPDKSGKFPGHVYEDIIQTGWRLKVKCIDIFIREPAGKRRDGRQKYRTGISTLSILQEFQRYYEDEDGQQINPDYESIWREYYNEEHLKEPPLYLIPITDEKGNILRTKNGSIRFRRATGILWRFASRFAELAKNKETAWVVYSDAIKILRRYLRQPAAFNLMFLTLFWINDHPEMSHEKLIKHLDIRNKNQNQVNRAIDAAFEAAFNEGIIESPVKIRPAGYYKPTKKTGRERRKGMVYQWHRARRWRGGRLAMIQAGIQLENYSADQENYSADQENYSADQEFSRGKMG